MLYISDAEWVFDYDSRIWVSQMLDGENERFIVEMEQQAIIDELRQSNGYNSRLIRHG